MTLLKSTIAGLALILSLPAWADYGVIQTSNGKTYQGTIQPAEGGFIVAGTNGSARVDLQQLSRLRLQPPPTSTSPTNAQHGLRGTYFSDSDCTGDRVVRIDSQIDFNWQDGPPIPGIGPMDFSVRWEGKLQAPATGKYTFYTQSEAVKLWVDNQLLIDKSDDAQVVNSGKSIELQEGQCYNFKMELYNRNMSSVVRLFWSGPAMASGLIPHEVLYAIPLDPTDGAQVPKCGLLGLYYNAPDLSGESLSRYDANIDFDWGEDAPLDGINPGQFSVRWLAKLIPKYTEAYKFTIASEDGARVWLNGNLIIDAWKEEPITVSSVSIPLRAGEKCDLRVEMYASRGAGKAKLIWSSRSTGEEVIPSSALIPTAALERDQRASETQPIPPGVRLASGSFLASTILSADESAVKLTGSTGPAEISMINVARLVFQPLKPESSVKLVAGRRGLLLNDNDFIEGEFRGIENGQIRIDSVLFGLKTYDLKQAMALVLRDLQPAPTPYQVRLRNGSVLQANEVRIARESILVEDSVLKDCKLAMADLLEIGRND